MIADGELREIKRTIHIDVQFQYNLVSRAITGEMKMRVLTTIWWPTILCLMVAPVLGQSDHQPIPRHDSKIWGQMFGGATVNDNTRVDGLNDKVSKRQEQDRSSYRAWEQHSNTLTTLNDDLKDMARPQVDPAKRPTLAQLNAKRTEIRNAAKAEKNAYSNWQNNKTAAANARQKQQQIEAIAKTMQRTAGAGTAIDVRQALPEGVDPLAELAVDRVPSNLHALFKTALVREAIAMYDHFERLDALLKKHKQAGGDDPLEIEEIRKAVELTKTVVDTVGSGDSGAGGGQQLFDPICGTCGRPLSMPPGPEHKR